MTNDDDFINKLETAIKKLEKKRDDAPGNKKRDLDMRIRYLEGLRREYEKENRLKEPRIFISFSGETGFELMNHVIKSLRQTESRLGGPRFRVKTGMRPDGPALVLPSIIKHMESCCIFLGILTEEYQLKNEDKDNEGNRSIPGPWALYEAGIAIGLGLRCVLLVESTVHKRFWFDILGGWKQVKFDKHAFDMGLKIAIDRIKEHYSELCEKSGL